jgi:peptidoglycan/xylan/chitin deacetylase (PgdA/CDA1 family)
MVPLGILGSPTMGRKPSGQPFPVNSALQKAGTTVVSFTFDDGWVNQYAARWMFAAHGMKATFYVNSSRIGTDGFLSWEQLEALEEEGHEIGGHGLEHVDLSQLSPEAARSQIAEDRANLLAHGLDVQSFAYPHGAYETTTESIVRECGYSSGRAAWGLRNIAARRDNRPRAETIPPPDRYAVLTPCCIDSNTDLAALQKYVLEVEKSDGGWVPFVLHRLCDDCGDSPAASIATCTLRRLLEWLHSRASRGTVVRTVAQVISGDFRARDSAIGIGDSRRHLI